MYNNILHVYSRRIEYNNNKGSRSKVNKHELVYGESSSNARDAPDICLSFVLLFKSLLLLLRKN